MKKTRKIAEFNGLCHVTFAKRFTREFYLNPKPRDSIRCDRFVNIRNAHRGNASRPHGGTLIHPLARLCDERRPTLDAWMIKRKEKKTVLTNGLAVYCVKTVKH